LGRRKGCIHDPCLSAFTRVRTYLPGDREGGMASKKKKKKQQGGVKGGRCCAAVVA
jgi:hypothetical protein